METKHEQKKNEALNKTDVSGSIKVRCFNKDGSINNGVIVAETFYSYEVLPDGCLEIERW